MEQDIEFRERLNLVQELLQDAMLELAERRRKSGKRIHMTSNGLARELGVNAGSLNQWLNGTRLPSYQNCMLLSQHPLIGDRIFEIMGFDKPIIPANASKALLFIVDNWEELTDKRQQYFFDIFKESLNGRNVEFTIDGEVYKL